MKTRLGRTLGRFAIAVLTLCLSTCLQAAPTDATEYPHTIAVEAGAVEFVPGDGIVITLLRGDRSHLEAGGHYLLEGRYTLESVENANLAWSVTSRGPSDPTPIEPGADTTVAKGSGTFRLTKTFFQDGWPHVSFYAPRDRSHGGVYFGEFGYENTILRTKGWSDFSEPHSGQPGGGSSRSADPSRTANRALMEYLGDPVPLPANLDARYTADGLTTTFNRLCKNAGVAVQKLLVDDSEFPCLVYGVLNGRREFFKEIDKVLGAEPGYAYGGSVVGRTQGGTYFSLNLTPSDQYPRGQVEAVHRRLMIRLQMLAEKVQKPE